MTWTDKPTSSTSTLPTSFFLHWRKSRQRLFWEIQIANIEFTFVRTTTITTNICERLYLACIWWYILTISTFDIELARVSRWKIKTDWIDVITKVDANCQVSRSNEDLALSCHILRRKGWHLLREWLSPIEGVKSEKVEPRPRSSGLKEGDTRPRGPWEVIMLLFWVRKQQYWWFWRWF